MAVSRCLRPWSFWTTRAKTRGKTKVDSDFKIVLAGLSWISPLTVFLQFLTRLFDCDLQRTRRAAAPARRPVPARAPASRPASTQASSSHPPPPPTPAPAPQMAHPPAPQQSSGGGGMLAGIGSTIAQGMAFGTGSAIAHRAVGAVASSFGGGSSEQPQAAEAPVAQQQNLSQTGGSCSSERQIYYDCLRDNKDDGAVCQFLLEQLKACNQNQMYS